MIEILRGDDLTKVPGHQRQIRFGTAGDLRFGNGDFLAGRIRIDDRRAFLTAEQAGDFSSVLQLHGPGMERGIDRAVGVEHIFQHAIKTAVADAIQLGANDCALAVDGVAGDAVGGKDFEAGVEGSFGGGVSGAALIDEGLGFSSERGKAFGESLEAGIDIRHFCGDECFADSGKVQDTRGNFTERDGQQKCFAAVRPGDHHAGGFGLQTAGGSADDIQKCGAGGWRGNDSKRIDSTLSNLKFLFISPDDSRKQRCIRIRIDGGEGLAGGDAGVGAGIGIRNNLAQQRLLIHKF